MSNVIMNTVCGIVIVGTIAMCATRYSATIPVVHVPTVVQERFVFPANLAPPSLTIFQIGKANSIPTIQYERTDTSNRMCKAYATANNQLALLGDTGINRQLMASNQAYLDSYCR